MCDVWNAATDHAENRITAQPPRRPSRTVEFGPDLPFPADSLLFNGKPDCPTASDLEAAVRGGSDGLSAPKRYPAPTPFIGARSSGGRGRLLIKI